MLRLGNYSSLGEVLGKGTFATVYKGFNSDTMEPVAIKEIDLTRLETMNAKHKEHLKQEVDVMKAAEHPNIVGLLEVRTNRSPTRNDFLFITLEYCNQGDFRKYLDQQPNRRLTEGQALYFMRQFANGLKYLQDNNIVHRDLKPQNLLLHKDDDGKLVLKIADFGFAKYMDSQQGLLETLCGSPLYMAPEILRGESYTALADLWSVGAILYEMLCGRPPFDCKTHYELFHLMNTEKIRVPYDVQVNLSDACKHFLMGLLQKNAQRRMPWDIFFTHPWITGEFPNEEASADAVPEEVPTTVPEPQPEEQIDNDVVASTMNIHISESNVGEVGGQIRSQLKLFHSIAGLAERSQDAGKPGQALTLLLHVMKGYRCILTKLNDFLKESRSGTELGSLQEIAQQIHSEFYQYVEIAEGLSNTVVPEGEASELIYEHALLLARAGVSQEMNKNYSSSEEFYGSGVMLLEQLQTSATDEERKIMLGEHLKRYTERLNAVRKAKMAQAAEATS